MTRRDFLVAGAGTAAAPALAADDPPTAASMGLLLYSYGIRAKAEKDRGFADPVRFLEFAHSRGANAVQVPLGTRAGDAAADVRRAADKLGVAVEGIVNPPGEGKTDQERFAAELAAAKACGAEVVRTVLLNGRRYEVFDKPADYPAFAKRAEATLRRAEPVARAAKVVLAVENHKDFRADEQVDLLKAIGSEWVGVCVDTGNNLALLDDPVETVKVLAPFARTVHLKDIGLEESPDGFRMAEVPLGQGCLDLPAMVKALRQANLQVRFQLEMITRDPLSIPCLTEKYWTTLGRVPGRDLARSLARVRATAGPKPLPRITKLSPTEQLAVEDHHVRASFSHAIQANLLAA
ncbi:MAG: sugar phosphate isomerase/epimerase [Gemmataceae bacterium]|nr:sugar phosphate isomerase/epimerase [Gemmataceae bacterium]